MKQIKMPYEGTLFSENKTQRLDYVANGNFVDVKVLSSAAMIQYPQYVHVKYKVISKCIFNKQQFENFLFTENWVAEKSEITFGE